MARRYEAETHLNKLQYSPHDNPLAAQTKIKTRTKMVRSGRAEMLANVATGEINHVSMLHELNTVDEEHFVKIFAAGVTAMFDLSRTAQKVFGKVLERYQQSEMTGGYADTVNLFWFDNGLTGESIDMARSTFKKGLRELIDKQFLAPRFPNQYWVNPNLFFKGDRVLFVREYVKQSKSKSKSKQMQNRDPNTVDFIEGITDAEKAEK